MPELTSHPVPGHSRAPSPRPARLLGPTLVCAVVIFATAVQLYHQGRRWWCACGEWSLCSGDAWGSHNSQHLFDPYSLTHVLHGVLLWTILVIALPRLPWLWRFALAVGLESVWEIFENSAFVINRYRSVTASLGYEGDSIFNSLGDILSCAAGFWLSSRLGYRKSLLFFLVIEFVLLIWIRDSLALNVVMLLYPVDAIRVWQTGG